MKTRKNSPTWCVLALGLAFLFEIAVADAADATSQLLSAEGTVELSRSGSTNWIPAEKDQELSPGDRLRTGRRSRATVRLADLSVFRVAELSTLSILAPAGDAKKPILDLKSGSAYFFSREKPADVGFRTPVMAGAIRGTEFNLEVAPADGHTRLTLVDGQVELGNEQGRLVMNSGEQATIPPGQAPTKTAMIDARNVIQWCLYYPAVLDPDELALSDAEKKDFAASLQSNRRGDLLAALAAVRELNPASEATRIYFAALNLAVGQVKQADDLLQEVPAAAPLANALRQMIAAVQHREWNATAPATTTSQWLAESYYRQSRSQLPEALTAAQAATKKSPTFGFAWVRVAELEFSLGRIPAAQVALDKGLELSPRNAQGLALRGFSAAAQNHFAQAIQWFDQAIAVDGGLGNAWLGRGLCRIRTGAVAAGRGDLQVAAAVEPNRAVLRSYLARAFSYTGQDALAAKDLRLARELDPNDPTSWLYSALIHQQHNEANDAIRDLEHSKALNDNRSVYRSRQLLDQDRAVRSANLATLYRDAGMFDVSVREAARAVTYDYANYSAHLFLANSYDTLRDPKLVNLRYEAAQTSELLIANLLAPVGAGNLSQHISQQEYSRLFDGDHFGFSSSTDYRSGGEWTQYGSHYGTFRNTSYAVDLFHHSDNGQRPNNDLRQLGLSAQLKQQLSVADSVYAQVTYGNIHSGDVNQYYSQAQASTGLRIREVQEPNIFLGYHHEWSPGVHTLLFAGRLHDDFRLGDPAANVIFLQQNAGIYTAASTVPNTIALQSELVAYTAEAQQIFQIGSHTAIAGVRYQTAAADSQNSVVENAFNQTLALQNISSDLERVNVYAYDQWQIVEQLHLTGGLSYDWLHYPLNIDISPITSAEDHTSRLSPKAGLVWTPWSETHVRAAYTRSLGGVFFDNSIRLEPSQVAGFNQAFRSLAPESSVGLVPGTRFETFSLGLDHKFKSNTYFGVEGEWLRSRGNRLVGILTNSLFIPAPDSPGSTRQSLEFDERTLLVNLNQLLGRDWSFGARYRLSRAELEGRFTEVPLTANNVSQINQDETATLQQLTLQLDYHVPCGFFSQFQSIWSHQNNSGYTPARSGDDFWQHNFAVGYRFTRRQAELRLALLNLADQDYQLNPLNLYSELPRERTLAVSFKFNF
jgi:predicted Zn-dependent protease